MGPHNKLVNRYLLRAERQQVIYSKQRQRGDADGQLSNTSPFRTIKEIAVPDGPPVMDIIGQVQF